MIRFLAGIALSCLLAGAAQAQVLQGTSGGRALSFSRNGGALMFTPFPNGGNEGGGGGTGGGPPITPTGVSLTTVSGLTDWWDATALSDTSTGTTVYNFMSPGGAPVTAWDSPVGTVASKGSGHHPLTAGGTGEVNWPKLVGMSGGLGNPNNYQRYVSWHWPEMFPNNVLTASPGSDFGSATDWSLLLVWSRPNTRQSINGQAIGGTGKTGDITLLTVGSVKVLTMGGAGTGSDVLHLMPTGANTSLGTMARRHTHTLLLVNNHTTGLTAVLDGNTVATGVSAAPLGTTNTGSLTFLAESGVTNGSAQLWFHEAAIWNRALGSTDLTAVDSILLSRYPAQLRGPRKGVAIVANGQSNAEYFWGPTSANATSIVSSGVAYELGLLAVTILNDDVNQNNTSYQVTGSTPIASRGTQTPGFLLNTDAPGPTFTPSGWPAGGPDTASQTNINAQSAADQADIGGIFWFWSETDAADWFYGDHATYTAVVRRQLQLERSYITAVQPTANAGNLPALMMAVPYGSPTQGAPMVREVYTDLRNSPDDNFWTYLQTFDTQSLTDGAQNATTGTWTLGTDNGHRSVLDDIRLAKRVVPALARMLMQSGRCEYYCSFPDVQRGAGPVIAAAARDATDPTLLHLTIAHDGGTDLKVGPTAALCHGFAVSNGSPFSSNLGCYNWGSGGTAGNVTRIDAKHLDVKFPSSTAAYSKLYYPMPSLETGTWPGIGRNNAVTDNVSAVAPAGWNLAEIGWTGQDVPLQMPGYPVTIGRILTVGPGKMYSTVAGAIAASANGDVIKVDSGTYTNDSAIISTSISLEAVGGRVKMVATTPLANEKGILVTGTTTSTPTVRIDGFDFSGASTPAGNNGSGVLYQNGTLILTNDYFYNNQDGLRGAPSTNGSITVDHCEFANNGINDGLTHNIYVGVMPSFTIRDSYSHDANGGHEIKSRALNNYIYNNRIFDNTGIASYSIDIPQSGNTVISGNIIQQSAATSNPAIIAYGEETGQTQNPGLTLNVFDNLIVDDLTTSTPIGVWNQGTGTATLMNNTVYGMTSGQVASGTNTQTGTYIITTRPTLDTTSHPYSPQ